MCWRIWRIVNGCAVQQLVARRDVIAPEFILNFSKTTIPLK
jgi:hypothetical protein